jgi:NADP-dependent alcohol dehydrogenase
MEQYLTYPHEGYLQDRIAEGILQTLLDWSKLWKTLKIMPWHLTLCGTMALNGLIQKVPNDWATHDWP